MRPPHRRGLEARPDRRPQSPSRPKTRPDSGTHVVSAGKGGKRRVVGVDARTVALVGFWLDLALGHASVATTQVYLSRVGAHEAVDAIAESPLDARVARASQDEAKESRFRDRRIKPSIRSRFRRQP